MISFPHAKINLGLYITDKRPDGYHNLLSCFYPIAWTDALEILPAKAFSYAASGLPVPGKEQDNLCVKAYHLLQKEFGLPPVQMHLHKVIPMGAGLGGGSADAAFALKSLSTIFNLALSEEALSDYGAALGSDCPFFIQDNTVIAAGTGDILQPVKVALQGYYLVVIYPGLSMNTAEAYRSIKPKACPADLEALLKRPVPEWKEKLFNDFEPVVFRKFPEVAAIKQKLYEMGAA